MTDILNSDFSNVQIEEHDLPRMATLEYALLEKKLLLADIIASLIFWAVAISILTIIAFVVNVDWVQSEYLYIVGGVLVLAILQMTFTYFAYFRKSYAVRERDIVYNAGLFWRSSTAIPFNRVQHCEVTVGPIDKLFNLSALKIFTAGGSSSDLSIDGLLPETAHRIKDFIVVKTGLDEEE